MHTVLFGIAGVEISRAVLQLISYIAEDKAVVIAIARKSIVVLIYFCHNVDVCNGAVIGRSNRRNADDDYLGIGGYGFYTLNELICALCHILDGEPLYAV